MKQLKVNGRYEHYSGKYYKAIGVARHSEILEELVVYQALYGKGQIWARPKEMFLEQVKIGNKMVDRFKLIE